MLNPFKRKQAHKLRIVADPNATRADLEIRCLLDDPNLRRVLGLDTTPAPAPRQLQEVAA